MILFNVMYNVYSTLNNNLCWSIVRACCLCEYNHAIFLLSTHYKEFTSKLFYRLFDFVYHRAGLKEYYKVLQRLPDKTDDELHFLQQLSKLMQEYKMKGGVLK